VCVCGAACLISILCVYFEACWNLPAHKSKHSHHEFSIVCMNIKICSQLSALNIEHNIEHTVLVVLHRNRVDYQQCYRMLSLVTNLKM